MINYELKSSKKGIFEKKLKVFKVKVGKEFTEYYQTYYEKLKYYCYGFTKDYEEAEDLTSQSFYKALENIEKFDPNCARLSTYLYTIAKNDALANKKKISNHMSLDYKVNEDGATISDFISDKSFDEDEKNSDLDSFILEKYDTAVNAIKTLEEPFKSFMILRAIKNKSYREISIHFREDSDYTINIDDFTQNYKDGVLTFYDSEEALGKNKPKMYSIDYIVDNKGNNVDFEIKKRDKNNLIEKIKILPGEYYLFGECPLNLSTVKSRIKRGKELIIEKTSIEIDSIIKKYKI